jgi:malonyl-CoA decarboxylase
MLSDLVTRIADAGWGLMAPAPRPDLAGLCEQLVSGRGEATGLAIARTIFDDYARLDAEGRATFFARLRDTFSVDPVALEAAITRWRDTGDAALRDLHQVSEPRSQELIRRLNRAPGGTSALVSMRRDLLDLMEDDPSFKPLDADFRHLFSSWFNRGFLELRRVDWSTSASVLEKIIRYEAVHEIHGWDDLRRRVAASDRRLYAFFHPALRDDPLIFVEVALTATIPGSIGAILAEERAMIAPDEAETAVFYSISNCQEGLRGISFGNFLIKQVVEELQRELPSVTTFVTLSPVPGLRSWALAQVEKGALPPRLSDAAARLEAGEPDPIAAEIAAQYLMVARGPRGGAVDPVARFHLGNGARLEQIHTGADKSARGGAGAWGVMVNYLYDLSTIEKNHEAYSTADEVIASTAVRRLLKPR